MHLYSLTLNKSNAVTQAIHGNFSGGAAEEIVVGKGKLLELMRPDDYGSLHSICEKEVFGIIRSLQLFRLPGSKVDHIVLGSDSGCISILKFNPESNDFERVQCETFGKTGMRRIVPGQYVATDPQGQAIMVSALEKTKLAYVIARDTDTRLTISSPLQFAKSHSVVYALCGLEVGFDNPIFAALELSHAEADQDPTGEAAKEATKKLVFYELNLGLNNLVIKWAEPCDRTANLLIPVPGGADGPGGVLVCSEGWIVYRNQDHPELRTTIPKRCDIPDGRGTLITSYAVHRQTNLFFFLLQSEYGDVFRVNIKYSGTSVENVNVRYFDTLPVASAMAVIKTHQSLFVAGEFGNHYFYHFEGNLEDEGEPNIVEASSIVIRDDDPEELKFFPPVFAPKRLRHLRLIEEIDSLAPLTDFQVAELLGEETPQIYAACGRGARSSLRVLRQGLAVTQFATTQLPGNPIAVWTVGKQAAPADPDEEGEPEVHDKYILVSFSNATMVLGMGESVQEVTDSHFVTNQQTLAVAHMHDGSMLQVHARGFLHVRDSGARTPWPREGDKQVTVERAAANSRQLVVSLSGGELVYFEMGEAGELVLQERSDLGAEVNCMDIAPVPPGLQRSPLLAVGGYDQTVRILSLEPGRCLTPLSTQALSAIAESLCLLGVPGSDRVTLSIGQTDGKLIRSQVDRSSGMLLDARPQLLGTRPVVCRSVDLRAGEGQEPVAAMLALSSRPWLCYRHRGRDLVTPLSYESIRGAASFSSEWVADGIVAIAEGSLRFLSIDKLGAHFNIQAFPLTYTPRKLLVRPGPVPAVVVVEGDHNTPAPAEREEAWGRLNELRQQQGEAPLPPGDPEDEEAPAPLTPAQTGYPKPAAPGRWSALVRLLDPGSGETLDTAHLEADEMAVSACLVSLAERGEEQLLAVGSVLGLRLQPRSHKGGRIRLFRFGSQGKLELLHKTPVPDVPLALAPAPDGLLLAGVGNTVMVLDWGKAQLLRKFVYRYLPSTVCFLRAQGERVFVGDQRESLSILKYDPLDRTLHALAEDTTPRFITAAETVDFGSVAGGDKFGNVFVLRVPSGASEEVQTGPKALWNESGSAAAKMEQICQFHVGEIVTSIRKAELSPGKSDALVFSTILGGIGAMVPFVSRRDLDFFSRLELAIRQEHTELVGRDHLQFRSYFIPVKDVVDGDLCEEYLSLSLEKQKKIAQELDSEPSKVINKIQDMRNALL